MLMSVENNHDEECHRFFAYSKRVPKDVKRFCGICRQHGVLLETRGHTCAYKNCSCNKCELVRTRRQVMSQQIRLRRAQDKRFQRTTEPGEADVVPIKETATSAQNGASQASKDAEELLVDAKSMCYFCQKCKNHGILVWKKHHKRQCPYVECPCEQCDLIETRRRLDQHIKRKKQAEKNNNNSNNAGSNASSPDDFAHSQQTITPQDDRHSVSSGYSANYENESLRTSPMEFSQSTPVPISTQSCVQMTEPAPMIVQSSAPQSLPQLQQPQQQPQPQVIYVHVPVPVPVSQMPVDQTFPTTYGTATTCNNAYVPQQQPTTAPSFSYSQPSQLQVYPAATCTSSFYSAPTTMPAHTSAFQPVQQQQTMQQLQTLQQPLAQALQQPQPQMLQAQPLPQTLQLPQPQVLQAQSMPQPLAQTLQQPQLQQQFVTTTTCAPLPQMTQPVPQCASGPIFAQPGPSTACSSQLTNMVQVQAQPIQVHQVQPAATTVQTMPPMPGSSVLVDPLLEQLLRNPCPDLATSNGDPQSSLSYKELERSLANKHQQWAVQQNVSAMPQQQPQPMDCFMSGIDQPTNVSQPQYSSFPPPSFVLS